MNLKKLLVSMTWLALFVFIFGSCKKNAVENQQDGVAVKQTQGTHLSLIGEITLEYLEEGPSLGRVRSITVLEDYILILDGLRKRVEVFDKEGNYKWSIGSREEGEGQYKIPREPTVIPNTDQMLIYDAGTGQILRFSLKGEFVGRLKLSERRFINRMLVSEDHNLIHTYVDKNKNGMLCVTSLDTGEDIVKFKVSDVQYGDLFFILQRFQGLVYDEARKIIHFVLPWEDKVMRIDLTAQDFLTPITINYPKFITVKVDEEKTGRELLKDKFSRLDGMYLLSSGDILLRYRFNDSSNSTSLILFSDLSVQPSAQEIKNKLGLYDVFTCHEMFVYSYVPPTDGEDTNGRIFVYRLSDPQKTPTG